MSEVPGAASQVVPPTTVPPTRGSGFARTAAVAVAALVIGGAGGLALGGSFGQSNSSYQFSQAVAYHNVLRANGRLVGDAFLTMGSECTAGAIDLSRCRAAALNAQAATQKWLSELGSMSVPACFARASQEVDAALEMYSEGVGDMIAGLDADNEPQIAKGAELVNRGIPHLNHATALINANPCGS